MLRVAHVYQLLGFNVLLPFGDFQKYDLVFEKNGIFTKAQVKTITEKDGVIPVDVRVVSHNRKAAWTYHPTKSDFDLIVVVESKTQHVYAIPFSGKNKRIHLRTVNSRNNQKNGVHYASHHLVYAGP